MKNLVYFILCLTFHINFLYSQTTITINVNPSTTVGSMPPIWRDNYENQCMDMEGIQALQYHIENT